MSRKIIALAGAVMSAIASLFSGKRSGSELNLSAVQNHVRANPDIAVEYLAALLKENFARLSSARSGRDRADDLFQAVADICTGRAARQRQLFQANLDGTRKPLVGHLLTCSDPILDALLRDSENHWLISRRVGAWLGGDDRTRFPFAAELGLSKDLGAPVVIALKHVDLQLASNHKFGCNCGCAAISMATTMIRAEAEGGKPFAALQQTAKERWIGEMAAATGPSAISDAQAQNVSIEEWGSFSRNVRRAAVRETVEVIKDLETANLRDGEVARKIIGAIVDQRTGDLWLRVDEQKNIYAVYEPMRSLRQIEKDLFLIAEGKEPNRESRAPEVKLGRTPGAS